MRVGRHQGRFRGRGAAALRVFRHDAAQVIDLRQELRAKGPFHGIVLFTTQHPQTFAQVLQTGIGLYQHELLLLIDQVGEIHEGRLVLLLQDGLFGKIRRRPAAMDIVFSEIVHINDKIRLRGAQHHAQGRREAANAPVTHGKAGRLRRFRRRKAHRDGAVAGF